MKFHEVLFHGFCFQQLLDVNDFMISAIIHLCSLALQALVFFP